ncbi:MAG: signal recognition particle protein [Bacillota bacterium]
MAFEGLGQRLQDIFQRLRGHGKMSEAHVAAAMREIRLALLEADVNFKVVKDFCERVKGRAVGSEVLESLTPAQAVVKIVHEELANLMGQSHRRLAFSPNPPTALMLVGLQGSGKTTTAGKLALHLKNQGHYPALVALDLKRPAAVEQLERVGKAVGVPVFRPQDESVPAAASLALREARARGNDVLVLDTAGRLHVDEELMEELEEVQGRAQPTETLLVVDAMTGQDAVNVAEAFHARLHLTGVILTKIDGDARGGAALSVLAVTGAPVKFTGTGEKLEALEPFHPDRMASRILGMGDVLSLVEKAQAAFDQKKAVEMERKLREQAFTLEDFLDQLKEVRKMGPLDEVLGMLPGMGKKLQGVQVDEAGLSRVEAIINSMTRRERLDPSIIDGSRRRRIAQGSGTHVQDVNRVLKQFHEMQKMFRRFKDVQRGKKKGRFPF